MIRDLLVKVRQSTSLLGSMFYMIVEVYDLSSKCSGSCMMIPETSLLLFKSFINLTISDAEFYTESD